MIKNCLICNKEMKIKPSHYNRRKTCSIDCLKKHKSIKMTGSGNHQFGVKGIENSSFKNILSINHGYIHIYLPNHPNSDKSGRIRYHRYVAEQYLKINPEYLDKDGFLLQEIDVHHIDENKLNNEPSNLQVLTRAEHTRIHNFLNGIPERDSLGRFIKTKQEEEI